MDSRNERLVYIIIAFVLSLFLIRFLPFLRYAIFIFLGLALVGIPIYWLYQRNRRRKEEKAFAASVEGRAQIQLERIQDLAEKNKEELMQISKSIRDIQDQEKEKLSPSNRAELKRLLADYEKEKVLRLTKRQFFKASIEKLETILNNKRLAEDLAKKKEELDAMREEQFEELAELENIKYDIESDIFYLDAIDELSDKLYLKSPSTSAETLKLELEKMTEKLKEM